LTVAARWSAWRARGPAQLAIPLGAFAAVGAEIAPELAPGAVLSDVGSSKQHVLDTLAPLLPGGVNLIPAHPVAGTEFSGPDAGMADLFDHRWCIITPPPGADAAAVERLVLELRHLNQDLGIPSPKAHGIDGARWAELLPTMASQALASGSPANNPRVPEAGEIVALYREMFG
jgi:prephenate dehydrogenase